MRAVGIRELKNKLSEYLRLVRAGESVLVTDRGEVIARLGPPDATSVRTDLPPEALDLARRGMASLPRQPREGRVPRLSRLVPDGTARRLVDEDRG